MKTFLKNIFVLITIFIFTSCATIINTTTQDVEIKSVPPFAKISIDGKKFGLTPQVVNIERGSNHTVRLELDGYEPLETQITKKISAWYWTNFLNGMIIGGLIDYINGSMYSLLPETIDLQLQASKPPPITPKK